ncbi:MAG: ABC transporter ATP-binding protein [Erysipelotrichaceae bacterium]|nr:ABC transporter ATP-binding protein [Erysipelotrichaceae bacterium]
MKNDKKTIPSDRAATLRCFIPYLSRYRYSLWIIALLVIFSAAVNLYGTYLIAPIINQYILPHNYDGLLQAVLFMCAMYTLGVISTAVYKQRMTKIAQAVILDIRKDLFEHMQSLPLQFFDTNTHGDIMSHYTNDLDTLQDAFHNCFDNIIQSFTIIVGTLIAIFILNWQLSCIVSLFMIIMTWLIQYYGKRSKKYFRVQQQAMGALNGFIEESVEGARVIKVFQHEQQSIADFEKRNENLRFASANALTYAGRTIPTVVSLSYVNYAIVACIGGFLVLSNQLMLGELSAYLIYVRQTAMPINQFTQQLNFILAALAGAQRIFTLMGIQPEIDEGRVTLAQVKRTADNSLTESEAHTGQWAWRHPHENKIEYVPLAGDVRFENVVFAYHSNQTILKGISLYAKPGQKIAFVGSTGAGKTTITNLINRFYDIAQGSIMYDGIDVKLIKKADLRRSIAIVLQDTHLFSDTIMENIRYGNLNASDEQVIEAAKLANAHSFIRRLPQGYQTQVQSDGANLSSGQRQLLAIARAAVCDPPVLILDEATSSIDTRTEKLIEKGMDQLMKGRTVFVIAHRLSTVRNADAIMVLDHGVIIERGSHEELLNKKGRYYQLYNGQFELD